jgi:hypothetical protein
MKTAGDIQFEPPTPKIFPLTSSITILTAGDSAFQAEIFSDVSVVVQNRIKEEPHNWWKVKDIANLYSYFYNTEKLKCSENTVLVPLGLNRDTFIARQSEMSEEFIKSITNKMLNFSLPDVTSIITGIDDEGEHIYVVNNDEVSCCDTIAFAAIGIGSRHASSQFMLAGHYKNSSFPDTLLLIYTAKKRSEVAPDVGEETNMFMLEPGLGASNFIGSDVMKKLDIEYRKIKRREAGIMNRAKKEMDDYVKRLLERPAIQQTQTPQEISEGTESTDKSEVSNNTEES